MNNIEKKHKQIIDNILNKSKIDIYHNNIDSEETNDLDDKNIKTYIHKKLFELKNVGPITNYKLWKNLIQHICSSHNIINKNNSYAQLLIDILDEKFILQQTEYKKIFSSLILNKKNHDIFIKLCERFGIYNIDHLNVLIFINNTIQIKNIEIYFKNYILSKTIKQNNYCNFYTKDLLYILCNKNIFSQLYINNDINGKIDDKIFEQFIQKLYLTENLYILYNIKFFENFIKDIKDNKFNKFNIDVNELKKTYLEISKQIYIKSVDIINNNEKYIGIYENIYRLKYKIIDKKDYYIDISKDLIEIETKLKSKLTYLNLEHYKIIDYNNSIHKMIHYISESPKFIEYMLQLYNNQCEQLNMDNYIEFAKLINYEKYINLQNPDSKKILYNIFNHRILHNKDLDLKLFVEIGFDENIMKNAMYTTNNFIIKCMLDNKYNAKASDLTNIYRKFTDKNNVLSENVKDILELYASYNIYMDKNILTQFMKNNDFSEKFKYITLKPYTIYKDEKDTEFNKIITEILEITKQQTRNNYVNDDDDDDDDDLLNEIEYLDKLEKNNKQISIDDIFKFAKFNVKFLLNKYIEQNIQIHSQSQQLINDNIEKPKKIIKKIIKKVIVKKSKAKNDN